MTNGAFLLGVSNQANDVSILTNVAERNQDTLNLFTGQIPNLRKRALYAATYGTGPAIEAASLRADAIVGAAMAQSDVGQGNILSGVRGIATRGQDRGVHGENRSGGTGVSGVGGQGVYGESTAGGIGVTGYASGGGFPLGVVGQANEGIGVSAVGMYGVSAAGNQIGVFAESNASGSIAVQGVSSQGIAVQGVSSNNIGVYASGASSGLIATTTGSIAARFNGSVFIENGDLTVFGSKSAAVPHPDGSRRQLYVLESPESWFEDFGQAILQNGEAYINIDPDFACLIRADDYQVFLTPYGDCNGLCVSERNSTGFTVRELQKGTSTLKFGYRVLARRKDIEAGRLQRVELPELPTPPEPSDFARRPAFEPPIQPQPITERDLPGQDRS